MHKINLMTFLLQIDSSQDMLDIPTMRTLRFKLSPAIQDTLSTFARAHSKDTLAQYRDAWSAWVRENGEALAEETKRLRELGFAGDVENKMYKAGRYYFARKVSNAVKAPRSAARRYVTASKAILARMDRHIEAVRDGTDFRPATAFERFAESTDLTEEFAALQEKGVPGDQVRAKLKHTYKNRCFLQRRRASLPDQGARS